MDRRTVIKVLAGGVVAMALPSKSRGQGVPGSLEKLLLASDLIYVATQRRSGERSSSKPIWFMYDQGKIFFITSPGSWKAKRIRRGSPLFINVGAKDGPALVGKAEAVKDAALIDRMGEAYSRKYWLAWAGLFRPRSGRVREGKTAAFLVTFHPA
jgi:hypothetical protein